MHCIRVSDYGGRDDETDACENEYDSEDGSSYLEPAVIAHRPLLHTQTRQGKDYLPLSNRTYAVPLSFQLAEAVYLPSSFFTAATIAPLLMPASSSS